MVDSFRSAVGGDDSNEFRTEIDQLVTLIRTKLEQTKAFYEVALSKQYSDQQRELLSRRARRAQDLVASEESVAVQLTAASHFLDAKVRTYNHIALQYLFEEARAYEYIFLRSYDDLLIDLPTMYQAPLDGPAYHQFLGRAETDLQTAFSRAADKQRAPSSCFSGLSFDLASLPQSEQSAFAQTGTLMVTIDLPEDTSYHGVTFSDIHVFLVGLPRSQRSTVTITATKVGVSKFLDQNGKE